MYICEKCGKSFPKQNGLGGHMNIHRSENIELTELQEQMILGSLLGDMWIYKNGHSGLNPELGVKHSTNQRDYIMWKYEMLRDIARGFPKEFAGSGYGEGTTMVAFHSKSLPCLIPIYNATHPDGNKCVTKEWVDMISHPISIATWFMDDGCRHNKNQFSFALGRTEQDACDLLQSFMIDRWDINTVIYTHVGKSGSRGVVQKYLHTNTKDSVKLKELIEPYVIPSMRYKIGVL